MVCDGAPGQVRVELPAALKQVLLEDWERVEGNALVALPRRPSIATLLQQYVDSCRTSRDVVEPEEEVRLFWARAQAPHAPHRGVLIARACGLLQRHVAVACTRQSLRV